MLQPLTAVLFCRRAQTLAAMPTRADSPQAHSAAHPMEELAALLPASSGPMAPLAGQPVEHVTLQSTALAALLSAQLTSTLRTGSPAAMARPTASLASAGRWQSSAGKTLATVSCTVHYNNCRQTS